jgi:F-type H+-transporting ATPase subunit epsilon
LKLTILTPTEVLFEQEVSKVTAEAQDGSFGLLPHHIDFVAPLVAGILSSESDDGQEQFFAVNEGVLVKCGPDVFVSTFQAMRGPNLGDLRRAMRESFEVSSDRERRARSALAHLQADLVRRYLELAQEE